MSEAQATRGVSLSRNDYEKWERVRRAFGHARVVTRACLANYGVRTADIRYFQRSYGLLEVEGEDVILVRGVKVVERKSVVVRDEVVVEDEEGDIDEPDVEISVVDKPAPSKSANRYAYGRAVISDTERLQRIESLPDRQRKLFSVCVAHTDWGFTQNVGKIDVAGVLDFGYKEEEIAELMVILDLIPNPPSYYFPNHLQGIQ